jgi:hypothetical protein
VLHGINKRSLRGADHSVIGASVCVCVCACVCVWCVCVWCECVCVCGVCVCVCVRARACSKPREWGDPGPLGTVAPQGQRNGFGA